jgi:hypothetical protein
MKILVFKDKWTQIKVGLKEDFPYFMEGRLPDNDDTNPSIYLENLTPLEEFLKKQARRVVIKLKYEVLTESFMTELAEKIQENHDTVPFMIAVSTADKYHITIGSQEGQGLKPTLSMKKNLELLTGENTVEILY